MRVVPDLFDEQGERRGVGAFVVVGDLVALNPARAGDVRRKFSRSSDLAIFSSKPTKARLQRIEVSIVEVERAQRDVAAGASACAARIRSRRWLPVAGTI